MTEPEPLREAYERHRRRLYGLAYRLTGSVAQAEDIVQETYVRALERPLSTAQPLGPWLSAVALNLGRDALRRRKSESYIGPWLPEPVLTDDDTPLELASESCPGARYELRESVAIAFRIALEALTPNERAVVVLRDVYEYDVRETARLLELSEANVKVLHHRARGALADYDRESSARPRTREQHLVALQAFFAACMQPDDAELFRLMLANARGISDGGGETRAARKIICGGGKVAAFHHKLAQGRQVVWSALREVNGLPGVVAELSPRKPGEPTLLVFQLGLAPTGQIAETLTMVAPSKLRGIPFERLRL